jgi:hypothetical protein
MPNNPVRFKLTIVKIGIKMPVEGKSYDRLTFTATCDRTGEKVSEFVTFRPQVMEALVEGKTIEADVEIDKERGQNVVVKIITNEPSREASIQAQVAVKAVADMSLSETIKIPDDILDDTFDLIKKWLKEALK